MAAPVSRDQFNHFEQRLRIWIIFFLSSYSPTPLFEISNTHCMCYVRAASQPNAFQMYATVHQYSIHVSYDMNLIFFLELFISNQMLDCSQRMRVYACAKRSCYPIGFVSKWMRVGELKQSAVIRPVNLEHFVTTIQLYKKPSIRML